MTNPNAPRKSRRARAGRPSGDDRDLRNHLLDTAATQFACTGIEASRLRAIADAAGVTPAMLHYYFGDKARLTQALIEERLLPAMVPLRERLQHMGDDPAALVEGFVRGVAAVIARHPWLPGLWVREVLCEGGALREIMFSQIVPNVPQMLAQRFATAQAAGRLNAALDPRLLVVSLVGLILFPAAGAPIWQRAFNASELDVDALVEHALALLGHGIAPVADGASA